ncbi:MAG: ACP S-malonyltransferase [Desulfovibrionaceae bacterium]|jgi:[acyl-carrier-protein] S-malonyltransferase|nr:ACP S-malonyltransferase [Desulfovibrionaceae bacterium]
MPDTTYAVLFPGQGSQEPGMGRDVAESSTEAMDLWKKAEKAAGARLREIFWDGDAQAMAETRYLQPALTVVNCTLWMEAARRVRPACFAGHSLGEFSALAAASVLPVADVIELTALRGRLMAEADPAGEGAMAALLKVDRIGAEEIVAEAAARTGRLLLVANYNSPAQFVASGHREAVEAVASLARERKARAVPLAVSGAFHSPMMAEAATELRKAMDKLSWSRPSVPVYCNATATAAVEAGQVREALSAQMTSSVRWIEILANQWEAGVRSWLEVGPRNVLAKLLSANLADRDEAWTGANVSTLEAAAAL